MKRVIICLMLMASCLKGAADTPDWVNRIAQCDVIDSIVDATERCKKSSDRSVYYIYYHQPLDHAEPEGEQFQLRCVMVVPPDTDPTTAVCQIYFQGYDIDLFWGYGALAYDVNSVAEITKRYGGILFIPEHRYFSFSSPNECWTRVEYCTASQAAQDFHALIQAMKTELLGKWAITGVSKGGICTSIQHALYPEDADIYVPNCGPLIHGIYDKEIHNYFVNNGWTDEARTRVNTMTKELVEDTEAFRIFTKLEKQNDPSQSDYTCWKNYYSNAMGISMTAHANITRNKIPKILNNNDSLRQVILQSYDFGDYDGNSMLNALYVQAAALDATSAWKQYLPKEVKPMQEPGEHLSVTYDEWTAISNTPYFYQACRELGYPTFDFHILYTEPEKQALADSLQAIWDQDGGDMIYVSFPFFEPVKYDGTLIATMEQSALEAVKPIVYVYGEDDCWTGSAIGDEFINGSTSHKFICAKNRHGVSITNAQERNEIWALLDAVLKDQTGIDPVVHPVADRQACYNLMGQRVSPTTRGLIIRGGKKVVRK